MKKALGLAFVAGTVGLALAACGSEEGKKKVPADYQAGGEGGGRTTGGQGTGAASGESTGPGGDGNTLGGAGATSTASGGSGGGGGGGGGEPGMECPAGFGECDGDLSDPCEQDLNLVTSCGACTTSCNDANGSVICEDLACKITGCEPGYADCDVAANDGCETLLTDNDEHCGGCGRDCTQYGSTCDIDSCGDIPINSNLPVYVGPFNGNAWAFSSLGVLQMTRTNTIVQRFPLDGTAPAVIWNSVSGQSGSETLVVDGTDVLWAQFGTPNLVRRKAIEAGQSALPLDEFAPLYVPTYLKIQGNAFYWITGDYGQPGYVYSRNRGAAPSEPGTRIVSVDQGSSASQSGFAVTTNAIYWVTADAVNGLANAIRTTPLAGGTPTNVPAATNAPDAMIKDLGSYTVSPSLTAVGDTLYFARTIAASSLNGVYRFKAGDAAPTKLVEAEDVGSFIVSDTSIYYCLLNQAGIWRAPIAGGAGEMIGDGYVSTLVGVDDDFVYAAFVNAPSKLYKIFR